MALETSESTGLIAKPYSKPLVANGLHMVSEVRALAEDVAGVNTKYPAARWDLLFVYDVHLSERGRGGWGQRGEGRVVMVGGW